MQIISSTYAALTPIQTDGFLVVYNPKNAGGSRLRFSWKVLDSDAVTVCKGDDLEIYAPALDTHQANVKALECLATFLSLDDGEGPFSEEMGEWISERLGSIQITQNELEDELRSVVMC